MPRFPHVFVCVLHCEPLEQGRGLAPARSEEVLPTPRASSTAQAACTQEPGHACTVSDLPPTPRCP